MTTYVAMIFDGEVPEVIIEAESMARAAGEVESRWGDDMLLELRRADYRDPLPTARALAECDRDEDR